MYRYNCLFNDIDCNLKVRPSSLIQRDFYGYFMDFKISRSDVLKLMDIDVIPVHVNNGHYVLRVRLNNRTSLTVNGIRVLNLENFSVDNLKTQDLYISEICLKRYSLAHKTLHHQCYGTRLIFRIPDNKLKEVVK